MSIYHSLEMTTQIISLEVGLAGGREGPGSDECSDGFSDKGLRGKKGWGREGDEKDERRGRGGGHEKKGNEEEGV